MDKLSEAMRLQVESMSKKRETELFNWMSERRPPPPKPRPKDDLYLNNSECWWKAKLVSGDLLPGKGWPRVLPIGDLTDDYVKNINRKNVTRRGNATVMGRFLAGICLGIKTSSLVEDNQRNRVRCYDLPSIEEARQSWEDKYGPVDWDSVEPETEGDAE